MWVDQNLSLALAGIIGRSPGVTVSVISLVSIPAGDHNQGSGVFATAEQFGGAVALAVLCLIFHATYLHQMQAKTAAARYPT